MEETIERITIAEEALDRILAAKEQLTKALEAYDEALDDLALFSDYYGSVEWFDDRVADENGQLPEDLKRGVLSEDLPYDALLDTRAMALQMIEIATDTLYIV